MLRHYRAAVLLIASALVVVAVPGMAHAFGEDDKYKQPSKPSGPSGDASGTSLMASVSNSKIKLTYPGGRTAKASMGALQSIDPNWERRSSSRTRLPPVRADS
ncbi:hypothetical protein [Streptomyces venezuelae]|uniref:hypothetical protein n=1 Tax=Streptomyces venezuelae TaxID=54571 RepID=UPI0037B58F22